MTSFTDPICGMTVTPEHAAGSSSVDGTVYYFCSAGCKAKFDSDPSKYLAPAAPEPGRAASNSSMDYVCPMDPEI